MQYVGLSQITTKSFIRNWFSLLSFEIVFPFVYRNCNKLCSERMSLSIKRKWNKRILSFNWISFSSLTLSLHLKREETHIIGYPVMIQREYYMTFWFAFPLRFLFSKHLNLRKMAKHTMRIYIQEPHIAFMKVIHIALENL